LTNKDYLAARLLIPLFHTRVFQDLALKLAGTFELDAEFGFQVNYSQSIKKAVQ
jgi:hypothetical protein